MKFKDRIAAAIKAWRLGDAVITNSSFGHFGDFEESRGIPNHRLVSMSTAVFAAIEMRAAAIAAIPMVVYRIDGDTKEPVKDGPLVDLLHRVNPFWTFNRLKEAIEVSMSTFGQAFLVVEKDSRGIPVELWFARADRMRVIPHRTEYIAGFVYKDGTKEIALEPQDVVWIRGMIDPADEFKCISPLTAARLSVESNLEALESNRNIFRNGLNPGGILSPKEQGVSLTREQRQSIEEQLNLRLRGKDKAHRLAVFSHAMQIDTPQLTPADAEFMNLLGWTLADVARAYKIPPTKLQDFTRATYSNVEQADKAFYTDCIIPECRRIAAELSEQLCPMFGPDLHVEFDFSKVPALQEDQTEITNQMVQLAGLGVPLNKLLTVYRPDLLPEDGKGYDWGDVPMVPGGVLMPPPVVESVEPAERILRVIRGKG